jgi:gamma-tubulin complex component 2
MTMQDQEAALLDDLLYVFMGYEGQYVRFAEAYSLVEERFDLLGPSFEYPRVLIQACGT